MCLERGVDRGDSGQQQHHIRETPLLQHWGGGGGSWTGYQHWSLHCPVLRSLDSELQCHLCPVQRRHHSGQCHPDSHWSRYSFELLFWFSDLEWLTLVNRLLFISTARGLRPRSTGPATSSPQVGSPPLAPGASTSTWMLGTLCPWPLGTRDTMVSSQDCGTSHYVLNLKKRTCNKQIQ